MTLTDKQLLEWAGNHSLLINGKKNVKLAKNTVRTYYLPLNSYKNNSMGVNLCTHASKDCIAACLVHSGMNGMTNVVESRTYKTELFLRYNIIFLTKLWAELMRINSLKGQTLVRLNLTSDVDWEKQFTQLSRTTGGHYSLGMLKNIVFYNYTKVPHHVEDNVLSNVEYTFSYSGYNWKKCEEFLQQKKANIAMIFFPYTPVEYMGYEVLNGDLNDERVGEGAGKIIGLRYKIARGKKFDPRTSPFVTKLETI